MWRIFIEDIILKTINKNRIDIKSSSDWGFGNDRLTHKLNSLSLLIRNQWFPLSICIQLGWFKQFLPLFERNLRFWLVPLPLKMDLKMNLFTLTNWRLQYTKWLKNQLDELSPGKSSDRQRFGRLGQPQPSMYSVHCTPSIWSSKFEPGGLLISLDFKETTRWFSNEWRRPSPIANGSHLKEIFRRF